MTGMVRHMNPQVAAVLGGDLRVAETYATAETVTNWYRTRWGLEFSITGRNRRSLFVTVQRKDGSLRRLPKIMRTEPRHVSPDNQGMNDGRRYWECAVGFGPVYHHISGFQTKIECTLTARQWFIAYGISPDSPGGWF
jgi:hypothetical protein